MMENRSFDHYLGWLATDNGYLEADRRLYGSRFRVDGSVDQTYLDPTGQRVSTRPASGGGSERIESRGCRFQAPGHSWVASRVQRDKRFLARGTGNDDFAVTYYQGDDLAIYAAMARRFTVFDDWHASLLGPTFPNRQYYLSAQSEGRKTDPVPPREGMYKAETIVDRLAAAGVPVGYYHTSVALLALWGADRMAPYIRSLDRYFEDAAAGTLPRVVFLEPGFGVGDALRTDDHPRGDIGLGQRWVREVFQAFVFHCQFDSGFLVENTRETKIRLFILQVTAPLGMGLIVAAVLGALAGALIARHMAAPELRRLRRERDDERPPST